MGPASACLHSSCHPGLDRRFQVRPLSPRLGCCTAQVGKSWARETNKRGCLQIRSLTSCDWRPPCCCCPARLATAASLLHHNYESSLCKLCLLRFSDEVCASCVHRQCNGAVPSPCSNSNKARHGGQNLKTISFPNHKPATRGICSLPSQGSFEPELQQKKHKHDMIRSALDLACGRRIPLWAEATRV